MRLKRRIDKHLQQLPVPIETGIRSLYKRVSNQSNPIEIACKVVDAQCPVIVDAGAHLGRTTEELLSLQPNASIHAIEPVPAHIQELKTRFGADRRVTIHPVALGSSDGSVRFNVTDGSATSSIYEPNESNRGHQKPEIYQVRETIEVPQRRLDSLLSHADLIKMDLQGGEFNALKGAPELLKTCQAVVIEAMFIPLYNDQPLFADIDAFLTGKGFQLFDIPRMSHKADGQLTNCDAVYLSNSLVGNR